MQRFDPPGAGRRSPNASFGPGPAAISSPPRDDAVVAAFEESGPSDGGRLLACLRSWAGRGSAVAAPPDGNVSRQRFHYLLRCGPGPGQLPDRQQLRERIDALEQPLPGGLATALLRGWPPPLRGLHRIELVPGQAWVSIAIGLEASKRRRVDFGMALPAPTPSDASDATNATDAIVVGAGLAGCALTDSLVRRGWRVTVIEGRSEVGGVVAGVPLLAQHPALSPGADRRSRLLVAALLASARLQDRLGDAFSWCGRFQPMPIGEARMRTAGVPPSVAEAVESSMAAFHGVTGLQGIWYPQCAMADPQRWWQRLRQSPLLDLRLSTVVGTISGGPGGWQASDGDGRAIATAAVLILANQAGAFPLARMPPVARGRLRISKQQVAIGTAVATLADSITAVSTTASPAERGPLPTLSGASYRIEEAGLRCVAGPIRHGEDDPLFQALLAPSPLPSAKADGTGYRWRLSPPAERLLLRDNLPMIGLAPDIDAILASRERFERNDRLPLPRREGLHLLTGLGGRGLLWSVLGAEIIAAKANGEPAVVESDLLEAIDPVRFMKRTLRRARSAGDATG